MSIKKEMLSKKNWAIYGITADAEKFGYKIPEVMKEKGYNVIGINKKYKGQDILGIKVYGSLEEVTEEVECIDVIVNPNISMLVVDEAIKKAFEVIRNDEKLKKMRIRLKPLRKPNAAEEIIAYLDIWRN